MVHGFLAWLVLIAAALSAVGFIWRKVLRPIVRGVDAIQHVVKRELSPNGGGSMKDQATLLIDEMRAFGAQLAQIDATQATTFAVWDSWSEKNQEEHAAIWAALANLGHERRGR